MSRRCLEFTREEKIGEETREERGERREERGEGGLDRCLLPYRFLI
jgi:hypothetical protein